ncbi:hypothetical protein HYFRA_00005142 [Hymenoscyphus fraxineus]|uniref:Uncharacterized protein n=1 Tax=Hymenoscyphus fraxineus TaxID=746836 RepID=A0A9N9L9U8_9HELO|nr:hypothetical protein HYFRA_00005142 [Hymenoscyphus fraxineus]
MSFKLLFRLLHKVLLPRAVVLPMSSNMPLPDPQSYTAGPSGTQDSAIKIGNWTLFPRNRTHPHDCTVDFERHFRSYHTKTSQKIPRHIVVLICMALMFLQRIVNIAVSFHVINGSAFYRGVKESSPREDSPMHLDNVSTEKFRQITRIHVLAHTVVNHI